jgi:hypothetical protein
LVLKRWSEVTFTPFTVIEPVTTALPFTFSAAALAPYTFRVPPELSRRLL